MNEYNIISEFMKEVQMYFPESMMDKINDEIALLEGSSFQINDIEITKSVKHYLLIMQYLQTKDNYIYTSDLEKISEVFNPESISITLFDAVNNGVFDTIKNDKINLATIDQDDRIRILMKFTGSLEEKHLIEKWIDAELEAQEVVDLCTSKNFLSAYMYVIGIKYLQSIYVDCPKSEYDELKELKRVFVARNIYKQYQKQYKLLKAVWGKNIFKRCMYRLMANNYLKDNTWDKYVPLLFYFYIYEYSSSGDSWSHVIDFLGLQFKNNPKEMSLFLKFMSIPEEKGGSLYVNDFCDAVEAYYNSIGESLPFDFSILPSRCTPECDTDESHKDWYEKVPKIKYQGCDNYLFRYLGKLYDRLVEKDWIEKDKKHTFIYRLSGYGFPLNLEIGIDWKGKGRELGFVILALYNYYDIEQDLIVSPRYSKIQAYFGVEGNIKSGLDKWETNKTWHKIERMLEDCGFTSLKPIKG